MIKINVSLIVRSRQSGCFLLAGFSQYSCCWRPHTDKLECSFFLYHFTILEIKEIKFHITGTVIFFFLISLISLIMSPNGTTMTFLCNLCTSIQYWPNWHNSRPLTRAVAAMSINSGLVLWYWQSSQLRLFEDYGMQYIWEIQILRLKDKTIYLFIFLLFCPH